MKLFPADWPGFLDELARWGELSIESRRAFLDGMAPGLSIDTAAGGAAVAELRDAGGDPGGVEGPDGVAGGPPGAAEPGGDLRGPEAVGSSQEDLAAADRALRHRVI